MKKFVPLLLTALLSLCPRASGQGQLARKNLGIAVTAAATTPTFIYSNVAPNSSGAGSGAGGAFSNTPDYRVPLDKNNVTAGSTILVAFGYENQSQTLTVSDDKADTYALDVTSAASNNRQMRMYRATNVAAGVTYVNIHADNANGGFWQPQVAVLYNADALDASSCNAGTGTSITAGSLTPTVTGDLIFQATYSPNYAEPNEMQTANFTAGSQPNINWSLISELLGDGAALQYGVYNSTTAINPTFTQAASANFISCAVALKSNATGSAPTATLRVVHQEHDAMPKNAQQNWKMGIVVTGGTVYISSMENDAISTNGVTSVPAPDVAWTPSGADFQGLNGHNHTTIWCGHFNTPPAAPVLITVNRTGTANDGIFMMYDVAGASCNLDVDNGGRNGNSSTFGPLTSASGFTPTHQNDIIFANMGQAFCTASSMGAPAGSMLDSVYYLGNSIDGATQTDENNGWMHYFNGSSLSAFNVQWVETCGSSQIGDWAGRVAAYQSSVSTGAPQPPTGLKAIVN